MIQSGKITDIIGTDNYSFHSNTTIHYLLLDSRKIISPAHSLYFAIKGIRHDGHAFIEDLYRQGVRNFITEKNFLIKAEQFPDANFWVVPNTIHALQKIVAHYRNQFQFPIIAITGSNGKTIVKEWLSQLLNNDYCIIKSPKSYNSQVGVPLSVWEINSRHTLGIFEAGISLPNEMQKLEKVIQPTIGILTNIGSAHDEGFSNREEKVKEKISLFKNIKVLFYRKGNETVDKNIDTLSCEKFSWSTEGTATVSIVEIKKSNTNTSILFEYQNNKHTLVIPFIDNASIENCIHTICTLLYFDYSLDEIQKRLYWLQPISMRLELKEGLHNSYIIDDTYNNDLAGLTMAINFLSQKNQKNYKTIILSDLLESGIEEHTLYQQVANLLTEKGIHKIIGIGNKVGLHKRYFQHLESAFYETTQDFLLQLKPKNFSDQMILVKGARIFSFEKIVTALQQKVHGTVLEINLDALANNLNFYRAQLKPKTKIMVIVKALAYGSGSFEVANLLQFQRADYLAVAYADEGVALRENGISLPIMVMNPSPQSFETIVHYKLEPELYSFSILNDFIQFINKKKESILVHLKIDTGMKRLGFEAAEITSLIEKIKDCTYIKVISVFTHLVAADDEAHNDFSKQQLTLFTNIASQIETGIGYSVLKHALNSAGIIRFPEAQMDMVRLGIGLYGVETNGLKQNELQTVGTLKTIISQIKKVKKGDTIGYNRVGKPKEDSTIATIAIGYADGYKRSFSNGVGKVFVNGQLCPIIGNVCMDMCMVDITGVEAHEGDQVILFGENPTIIDLAKSIHTIPYEILTSVSERVKRVFFAE